MHVLVGAGISERGRKKMGRFMVYPLPCQFIYYSLLPALRLCLWTWLPMWLFLKQNLRMPDPR